MNFYSFMTFTTSGIISPAYEVFDVVKGAANAIFISYLLNSIIISSQIYNAAQGGTRLALRFSTLAKFRVKLPPLNEQKKIAEILSRIDNKISLSKQKVQKKGFLLKAYTHICLNIYLFYIYNIIFFYSLLLKNVVVI